MYWPFSMVDYTERRKTEREKSFCMFYITCGPTTQREENFFFREKFLNFIIIKFCSKVFFVVFVSAAVYWEIITIGVDYTDFERLRREKKGKMFPIIIITCGGSPQREEVLRKILGGGYIINFMKQNYTDFEEERLREKKGI